ncbi:metallo-beta-lactamase family protein [Hymenobacter gelipurpurascens]|uniref:Metallo-beta-lactamase family protein n=1 Tax=Hymenobacter gelipurpurascens TaxID=89968 RepID=A0A212TKD7_9BACT|nr:MBL fold metallo-hydrolase [Hymenobacter gelipurpurascens]SNC66508.1 metallo-beta-lactamase family protein [Hymenobacter gelipurpurascens]
MNVRLQFLGAAHCVTGSKYWLTLDGLPTPHHVLIDCGLFQGLKELRLRNREELPLDPSLLDPVILTHAHIDHTGYLPKLVHNGFRGRIFCTEPTADLLSIMLLDSAKLQEEEAAFANAKGYSSHHPAVALYTQTDVLQVLPLVESVAYDSELTLCEGALTLTYREAGHILGSAIAELTVQGATQRKQLVFSGDLGRYDNPVMHAPAVIREADVLLVESTYGDRDTHLQNPEEELANVVNEALRRGGVLVVAAFAVGRTQSLLYYLKKLRQEGRVPQAPVYVDSPMGIRVSDLYPRHPSAHRLGHGNVFDFSGLRFVTESWESKALNDKSGPAIIISASGMCTGGRIMHHLYHRLPKPQDTLLLIGYQAEGTRGRDLQEGAASVKIFGAAVPVHCQVQHLDGFSAHADRQDLLRWLDQFRHPPQQTFVVHGEPAAADALATTLRQRGWSNVRVPGYLDHVLLFENI